eukprot:gene11910-12174_t
MPASRRDPTASLQRYDASQQGWVDCDAAIVAPRRPVPPVSPRGPPQLPPAPAPAHKKGGAPRPRPALRVWVGNICRYAVSICGMRHGSAACGMDLRYAACRACL